MDVTNEMCLTSVSGILVSVSLTIGTFIIVPIQLIVVCLDKPPVPRLSSSLHHVSLFTDKTVSFTVSHHARLNASGTSSVPACLEFKPPGLSSDRQSSPQISFRDSCVPACLGAHEFRSGLWTFLVSVSMYDVPSFNGVLSCPGLIRGRPALCWMPSSR